MSSPASVLGFRDVLRTPAVKRLWIAQIVSIFGDFLAVFAVISVVTFQLHGTPTQVSMILAAYMAPLAVISPLAGVFVDKWNVKWTMVASDLIRGVLVIALLFVRDLNAIYGIFFLLSTVSSFYIPAQTVAIRTLAPEGGLMSVNALMSQAMQALPDRQPGRLRTHGTRRSAPTPASSSTSSASSFPLGWWHRCPFAGPRRRPGRHRCSVRWAMVSASSSPIR